MIPSITAGRSVTATSDVSPLLEQRAQLQGWLARLDEVRDEADARIVERIRGDYQERLRSVLDALAGHLDALRQERGAREEALEAAEEDRRGAADTLEEARLRHRIGELAEGEWEERRETLEGRLASADQRCNQARAEAARLTEIVAQIESGLDAKGLPDQPAPHPEPAAAERERFAEEDDDTLSPTIRMDMAEIALVTAALAPPEVPEPSPPPAEAEAPQEAGEDLAFLEELDRAIEASLSLAGRGGAGGRGGDGIGPEEAPATTPGAKCPECGYTNDAEAWQCGVCGVDLS